jgi:MHS family proline/betaine transporter-like MFS transporter
MSRQSPALVIGVSSIGTIIEVYDFLIYGYLAVILGKLLFPPTVDPLVATLSALLVFGVGFVMRPVGGIVFAHIGDKFGRRPALVISLLLMAFASLGIGLLPTYAEIGILATILLVIFRLLQGFSLGGEYGSAIVYVIEHAPAERRGLYNGILQSVWAWGPFLGVVTLFINAAFLGPAAVEAYAWRYPFFVAAALAIIGIFIRLYIAETPIFKGLKEKGEVLKNPIVISFRKVWKMMLSILIIEACSAYIYYTATVPIFTTVWQGILKIPLMTTLISFIIIYLIVGILLPLGGYLIDKYGRVPIFRWFTLTLAIITLPLYSLFLITKDISILIIVTLIPIVLELIFHTSFTLLFAEALPANVRVTGFNVAYQIGVGVLGGFAPFITTALLLMTGSILGATVPLVVAAAVAALFGWLWISETKGIDLSKALPLK